jgi:hypothetical protein
VQLKVILKEKRLARVGHQGGLVLAWQCPRSTGTCNPEENGLPRFPMFWSPTPFSDLALIGVSPVPWTEKTIESSPLFVDAEVIVAAETWLERQPSEFFFDWLAKVRATD